MNHVGSRILAIEITEETTKMVRVDHWNTLVYLH